MTAPVAEHTLQPVAPNSSHVVYAQAQRKIAARDDQLSLFDFGSFNGQRDLPDTIGPMAERHWREFRPKMVRDLETRGILMETLLEA